IEVGVLWPVIVEETFYEGPLEVVWHIARALVEMELHGGGIAWRPVGSERPDAAPHEALGRSAQASSSRTAMARAWPWSPSAVARARMAPASSASWAAEYSITFWRRTKVLADKGDENRAVPDVGSV